MCPLRAGPVVIINQAVELASKEVSKIENPW